MAQPKPSEAEHMADLFNNVYGRAVTGLWDDVDVARHMPADARGAWLGGQHVFTFKDGSQAIAHYDGRGVRVTVVTGSAL